MLDLEMLVLFADAALAQGQKLLALGERAHSDSPLFECNWHRKNLRPVPRRWLLGRHGRPIVTKCKGPFKGNIIRHFTR